MGGQSSEAERSAAEESQPDAAEGSGWAGFFNPFRRAAASDSFFDEGISTCSPGNMILLTSAGAVQRFGPKGYKESLDIPYGTYTRNGGNHTFTALSNNDYIQYFDGLGESRDKIFAFSVNDHDPGNPNPWIKGRTSLYEYVKAEKQWYAYGPNGRVPMSWSPSLDTSPNRSTPTYVPYGDTYSFGDSFTTFIAGAAMPDGTYVFAGTNGGPRDSVQFMKYFALTTSGEINYLGYSRLPAPRRGFQHQGDIVFDKNGNLYSSIGHHLNSRPQSLQISISKIDAAAVQDMLANPLGRWRNGRWIDQNGQPIKFNTYHRTEINLGPEHLHRETPSEMVLNSHTIDLPGINIQKYSGFDITPTGDLTVGIQGEDTRNYAIRAMIYTIERNGNTDSQVLQGGMTVQSAWDNGYGKLSRGATDIAGCIQAAKLRPIVVKKNVVGRAGNADQFQFVETSEIGISSPASYEGVTSGSTTGERVVIDRHDRAAGATLTIRESFTQNNADDYTTTVQCYDGRQRIQAQVSDEGRTAEFVVPKGERNTPVECTFTNTPQIKGQVTLTKLDGTTRQALSDVQFKLYPDRNGNYDAAAQPLPVSTGGTTTPTTNRSGQITWQNLAPGRYWVVETAAPTGYEQARPVSVNVTRNQRQATVTVENQRALGTLRIEKVAEDNGAHLVASRWRLTGPVGTNGAQGSVVFEDFENDVTITGDRDARAGFIEKDKLPWGRYVLEEIQAPEGYSIDPNANRWEFELGRNGMEHDLTGPRKITNLKNGTLIFEKVSASDYQPLAGTEWRLHGPLGKDGAPGYFTIQDNDASARTSGKNDTDDRPGMFRIENLRLGSYTLEERRTARGHILLTERVAFQVTRDTREVRLTGNRRIVNDYTRGTLNIDKVSVRDGLRLAGSEWKIIGPIVNGRGPEVRVADNGPGSRDTNPNPGQIRVENLTWGTYKLVETQAPAGFELSTREYTFEINAASLTQNFTGRNAISNTPHTGPQIPHTGGIGRDHFIIGGFVLLGGAAGISLAFGRKRRESR